MLYCIALYSFFGQEYFQQEDEATESLATGSQVRH